MINQRRRVGIFGGTFNPPHIAHVRVAKAFYERAELDLLWIIPTNQPPHKKYAGNVSAQDRFNMCELAFSEISGASVSDIEIVRGGKSYTVDTLTCLSADDIELFLLCGTDMFLSLDTWFQAEKIFKLATICYVRREDDAEIATVIDAKRIEYVKKFCARIMEIPIGVQEVSSTDIRERIVSGDYGEIPSKVAEYIKERKLYL